MLTPYVYAARIVRVYDGDTVFVDIDLGLQVWMHDQAIRLWGVNAPEVRGVERPQGLASRDWLRGRLDGVDLWIRTYKDRQGKYGRWLAELFDGDENINASLVAAGHATLVAGVTLTEA